MLGALHPLLLWGVAAISAPILIHLLLRQRPRPRPWAAMRWLAAALREAQRRYRLTNLLLLLLRCLVVALAALAVARPNLAGLGSGGRLVLVVDTTASMGARGDDLGPLAAAKSALADARLADRVAVVAVSDRTRLIADGNAVEARDAVARLEAEPLPGGVDRAADAEAGGDLMAALTPEADVVVISDFAQDDGALLDQALADRCRSRARWQVGHGGENAVVAGLVTLPDLEPGRPGELLLRIDGRCDEARIAVDGGPATPAPLTGEAALRRLALPPVDAGDHRLAIELVDRGLAYDNLLELPLAARAEVPTLAVQNQVDYLGAALAADSRSFQHTAINPAQLPTRAALPRRGLVALRDRIAEGARVADWVRRDGGVLWARRDLLAEDPALAPLIAGIEPQEGFADGGALASGEADIDTALALGRIARVPRHRLPAEAEVLLRAGEVPLVVAARAGAGWVVAELADLTGESEFTGSATTPLWVRRVARRLTARLAQPRVWEAGTPAPEAVRLKRAGAAVAIAAAAPLLAAPGVWQHELDDGAVEPVVVLPSRPEGRLDRRAGAGIAHDAAEALPRPRGADFGLPLLIAALAVLVLEGALAAWAGRTYGR